jgi:hypothetical protein
VTLVAIGCTSNPGGGDDGVSPFGRPWTFTVESASISSTAANGTPWDADNSPPDPFARVYLDGVLIGTPPELQNTLTPVWNYSPSAVVINAGSTLSIDLIDSDVLDDDVIFQGCAIALTENLAAAGGGTCSSPQGSLMHSVSVN